MTGAGPTLRRAARIARLCLLLSGLWPLQPALADKPVFELEIRDHLFWPSELRVPANTRIKLLVTNSDTTPEEFESYELNREKVIMGQRTTVIFVGPLAPGEYPFFGEFHPKTAQGKLIAQ